jgi:hypothetical protein
MYYIVNDKNAIAMKYFDLETSAVWQFRKVNSCLRMEKAETNAVDCDFNVILN